MIDLKFSRDIKEYWKSANVVLDLVDWAYGDARAPLLSNLKIHDLVSKFSDRVEDSTL